MDNTRYNYILVAGNMYINVSIGIVKLFLLLLFRARPFPYLIRTTRNHLLNSMPTFIRLIRVLQFTALYYKVKKKYQIGFVTSLELKENGHCLLKLRQGEYKIFNLENKLVITVFPKNYTSFEVEERINRLKESSECKLAPNLIVSNLNKRYVIEEYINLNRPSYDLRNIQNFYSGIFPVLENIITTSKPNMVDLNKFCSEQITFIKNLHESVQVNHPNSRDKVYQIKTFCLDTINFLKYNNNHEEIVTVFSHGDLWEGNILTDKNSTQVIDWSTLGERSCFFDFYYTMFMLASKNSHFDKIDYNGINKLVDELDTGFKKFINKIKKNSLFISFENDKISYYFSIYRHIFYLELINLKLEMDNTPSEKRIKEIITWINRFKIYEKIKNDLQGEYEGNISHIKLM